MCRSQSKECELEVDRFEPDCDDLEDGYAYDEPEPSSSSNLLLTVKWVGTWFFSGFIINLLLKALSGPEIGFQFMITLTLSHFVCQSLLLHSLFRFTNFFGEPPKTQDGDRLTIASVGIFTALDIALTNLAFAHLSLGCLTVLKNLVPLAVYIIACLKGVEQWRADLLITIVVICGGISLIVTDVQASFLGVALVLSAVIASGLRWVTVQQLGGRYSSMQQMALTQPYAALSLLPYVGFVEAPKYFSAAPVPMIGWGYALGTALCSVFLVLSMFKIAEYTSAVTLTILGNTRGCLIILFGAFWFGEWRDYSLIGWIGLFSSMAGVAVYGHLRQKKQPPQKEVDAEVEMHMDDDDSVLSVQSP